MHRIILAGLLFISSSTSGIADPAWFYSIGGSFVSFDREDGTLEPINALLRGGLAINEHIEIGVESNTTLSDDDISGVDFDVDMTFVFIKAKFQVTQNTEIYALFGPSSIELVQGSGSSTITMDDSDTGIGFGAQFFTGGNDSAFLVEYISYYDDDEFDSVSGDVTVDSINIGYVGYF